MTRPAPPRRVSRFRAPQAARSAPRELADLLVDVWRQVLVDGLAEITVGRRRLPVEFTKTKHLRTVEVLYRSVRLFGIEQNPRTSSRWAKLAREGKRVMQFNAGGRYVANVCEGKLFRYPAWRAMGLVE